MTRLTTCLFLISLSCATWAGAANPTSSIYTLEGQVVNVGDSFTDMETQMKQSPLSVNSTTWKDTKKNVNAMNYVYDMGDRIYTITVVKDQIRHIEWVKKN